METIKQLKIDHKKEVEKLKEEHQDKLASKETLVNYVLGVLKNAGSLINYWQTLVKSQARELSKMLNYAEMENILTEKGKVIMLQAQTIKSLEKMIST